MGKTIKKIWNIITNIIVVLAVILAVALVGVRLVGLQVFTVLSGSMEPTYHVGSLIYVKDVDYKELEAGDVITFMLDEDTVATHRITEVVPDEEEPDTLNREILVELVDYIKVYENGNISVKFKFADELRKIAEYIEINTTEDTAVAG